MTCTEDACGYVFNIQRYSLHDGPGIRTTVFLSGCPMSCAWCSNPESQTLKGAIMHNDKNCLRCGRCVEVCPIEAIEMSTNGPVIDRAVCDLCGVCAENCPPHAIKLSAGTKTVDEVMETVISDRPFYRRTGGGMTVSGGEPLLQRDFSVALLESAKKSSIGTALETAGYVPWPSLEAVVPWVDHLLYDVKHLDSRRHEELTGVPNEVILENLRRVAPVARHLIVRVPVIPGFNSADEDIGEIGEFAATLDGVEEVHLLPYHRHGQAKYAQLDRPYDFEGVPISEQREKELAEIVRDFGVTCRIRG